MTRMLKVSLISGIFLGGLPTLALTGCSSSSSSSEEVASIEGLSPGEYRDKVQHDQQKAAKAGKKVRKRY